MEATLPRIEITRKRANNLYRIRTTDRRFNDCFYGFVLGRDNGAYIVRPISEIKESLRRMHGLRGLRLLHDVTKIERTEVFMNHRNKIYEYDIVRVDYNEFGKPIEEYVRFLRR